MVSWLDDTARQPGPSINTNKSFCFGFKLLTISTLRRDTQQTATSLATGFGLQKNHTIDIRKCQWTQKAWFVLTLNQTVTAFWHQKWAKIRLVSAAATRSVGRMTQLLNQGWWTPRSCCPFHTASCSPSSSRGEAPVPPSPLWMWSCSAGAQTQTRWHSFASVLAYHNSTGTGHGVG